MCCVPTDRGAWRGRQFSDIPLLLGTVGLQVVEGLSSYKHDLCKTDNLTSSNSSRVGDRSLLTGEVRQLIGESLSVAARRGNTNIASSELNGVEDSTDLQDRTNGGEGDFNWGARESKHFRADISCTAEGSRSA